MDIVRFDDLASMFAFGLALSYVNTGTAFGVAEARAYPDISTTIYLARVHCYVTKCAAVLILLASEVVGAPVLHDFCDQSSSH